MSTPSEVLDYPWPKAQIPTAVEMLLGRSDFISPSFYLRKGIEIVLDVDPAEESARREKLGLPPLDEPPPGQATVRCCAPPTVWFRPLPYR